MLHLFANYKAVKSLGLVTFNSERLNRYLCKHLVTQASYSPKEVNRWESVIVGRSYRDNQLCGFTVKLGYSIRQLVESRQIKSEELLVMADMFKHRKYMLVPNVQQRIIYVLLHPGAKTEDILQSYFHSILLALAVCHLKTIPLKVFGDPNKYGVLKQIVEGVKKLSWSTSTDSQCPIEAVTVSEDIVDSEFQHFLKGITVQGWSTDSHSLEVDEWRGEWRNSDLNEIKKDK